jgi:flagellar biosynthesis/type III secretory pathway chaperone
MTEDNTNHLQDTVMHLLKLETEQTQALLNLLERENELLHASPSQALTDLQAEKRALLKQVENSAIQHRQLLIQQGLSADRSGTEALIQGHGALQAQWQTYLSLLQRCQRQNEINGAAVELNQRQVNQALNILLGIGNSQKTYGRSGEARPTNATNSLGKA